MPKGGKNNIFQMSTVAAQIQKHWDASEREGIWSWFKQRGHKDNTGYRLISWELNLPICGSLEYSLVVVSILTGINDIFRFYSRVLSKHFLCGYI